ncbi:MAG: glutaredoxin [Dehalococcoidia bacterium]|nr:glutaredoxin [Dehalococcoidia bacterium]
MPVLSDQDRKTLEDRLRRDLKGDVLVKLFTVRSAGLLVVPGRECPTCPQVNELLKEVAALSPHIKLETYDFYTQREEAQQHGVDRIPCIILGKAGQKASNVKYYGLPSGYEFLVLLEGIVALSRATNPLSPLTRKALRKLEEDVHIQVFVTPTCTYCPQVARMAHAMGMETERIKAEVIEVQEFPHLAQMYQVQGVPKMVINRTVEVVGAVPERTLLQKVLTAAGREDLLEVAKIDKAQEPDGGPSSLLGSAPKRS